ncbi:MAG: uracil-DNA glycosylase family protein [Polyangiaceae bacterium]
MSLVSLAKKLRTATHALPFPSAAYVYEPLDYAWPVAEKYLKLGAGEKKVVFVGMNPGPFGMGQTGVPFGEVSLVLDWMKLDGKIGRPKHEHPKRPVLGLASTRSEVSGKRLWGSIAQKFPDAKKFFAQAIILNYCPLLYLTESGSNLTPDKLTKAERTRVERICDEHLREALLEISPDIAVGVGQYATAKLRMVSPDKIRVINILHPSPASPAANKDWIGSVRKSLAEVKLGHLM